MMKLHTLALCFGVFIEAAGAFLHPAFTARVGTNYFQTAGQPVLFDDVITHVGNMYNRVTRTLRIPGDGTYWITLNVHPTPPIERLVLYINGKKSKFYAQAEEVPSSKSGSFFLWYGFTLTVMLEGNGFLEKDTLWSVIYIGWGGQAFVGQLYGWKTAVNPIPFFDVIVRLNNNIFQDHDTREFTVLVDSLYLVHLSLAGGNNLVVGLQKQDPWTSPAWEEILSTVSKGGKQTSVEAIFSFLKGTKLRVMRLEQINTGLPENGTTLSITSVGALIFDNTTAFTGEVRRPVSLYLRNEPVKFDFAHINIDNSYNASTGIYTVPYTFVYIVSLTPKAAPSQRMVYKNSSHLSVQTVCCKPLTFTLTNDTHTLFRVTTDYNVPTGVSAAVYLRAGDKLKVVAYTPDVTYSGVMYGSIFSIANLYLCCPSAGGTR